MSEQTPLPQDLSQGWLPEDKRQRPFSPLPKPSLLSFQSLLPFSYLNRLRHPGEIPFLITAYLVTLLVYMVAGVIVLSAFFTLANDAVPADPGGLFSQFVFLALYFPLAIFWVRALGYAKLRLQGVRISPTQFPEAYQMLVEAAYSAGLRRVPDAYVLLGNGQINAFASGHGHRRFVALYSDLFEVGGKARQPEALKFIIAHEVGHIAAGHTSYFRMIFTSFFTFVPFAGSTLSRAQEYTADNFGYRLCPQGAMSAMSVLAAGKYLNRDVNTDEVANRAVYESGFFTWLANLNASHPPLTWRTHSLRDRSEPGRLVWRPRRNPQHPISLVPAAEPAAMWPDPLQATDFMAIYPEDPANQHWGVVLTEPKVAAKERDRQVADTLFTGWIPPQLRQAPAQEPPKPVVGNDPEDTGPASPDDDAPNPPVDAP